ncbi:hypothetical protein Glove_441g117 [Diversispora epigaea]|uniref:SAM domain-containing protein n=1 Tax=Diversispora epigaea TaxID=1348612 RepID=A0A397GVR9_9GLOM|nr:hypothetical protein Glove_441g117 [Diversispora epigaea]
MFEQSSPASASTANEENPAPILVEVVRKYNAEQLIQFLREKEEDLQFNDAHFEILRNQEITGRDFFKLTKDEYMQAGMKLGPATRLVDFAKEIKGEQPVVEYYGGGKKIENERLKNFWKALKDTKFHIDDDEFFQLPRDAHFFGSNEKPSIIYIRKCYNDLLNIVLDDNIRRLRISGNPGIGKTFFGYYLLYHLALSNKTVIYDIHTMSESNQVILFEQEKAFYLHRTHDANEIRRYLDDSNVWHIVDGKKSDEVDAKTILICSPMKHYYKGFDKYIGTTIRYMPVWEWKEIDACRVMIYNHLEESEIKQLFFKWGGIPRFVLEKASDQTQQNLLEEAIARCDEKIFNYIGESDIRDEVSHKLIHICTNPLIDESEDDESEDDGSDIEIESDEEVEYFNEEPYTLKTIAFASEHVGGKVTEKLKTSILDRLRTEFELSLTEGINNPYLGSCFEQMAHRMLRNGGTFEVRSLEPNDSRRELTQDIKKQNEILTFSAIQTIEDGKYYRPDNKNFPSIDAIIAPDTLFQITTAMNHPIKIIGLKRLYNKLAKTGEISFYFVVPAELYDYYQKQKFIVTNNSIARKMPGWIKNRIKQYALKIDLSSEGSSRSSLKRRVSSLGGASSSKRGKK